jgi:hypothetical protein
MRFRPKLTYANVMVTVLAFVVLCGGGAYAAGHLGKSSVGSRQLKKNAVTGIKVKDGSLTARDLANGVLRAGPQGPRGLQGLQGLQGLPGTSHGFQASGSVNFDKFSSSPFGSTVVTLVVPPGAYFATASVQAETVNFVESTVTCRLIDGVGGPESTGATTRTQAVRDDGLSENFTLTALFLVTAGQALNLQCSKSSAGSSARITAANVVAIQIADLSGQTD